MRKIQKEFQDITWSALVTAIVFINDLLFGAGVSYQYYAYFFIGGVFYIRLRMIGLDLEAVQKQLNNHRVLTGQKDETITVLLDFVGRFRFYSPYNAMLIHTQMPGAHYVAPPHRWLEQYRRRIKPGARPLVILQPMGPVMFVYDVSDTEPEQDALPLPPEIERPFEVEGSGLGGELWKTIENAKRDGIRIAKREAGSQDAGEIHRAEGEKYVEFQIKQRPEPEYISVRVRYNLLLNSQLSPAAQYATFVHELGHLYCGHLGSPNLKWWPDRRGLSHQLREFEAESVCYLLCMRLSIDNPSARYLAQYMENHKETPAISLECVIKSAGLIEQMGREHLKPRKETE